MPVAVERLNLNAVKPAGAANPAGQPQGAQAFAQGNDVHFKAGEYNPASAEGDKLLAHEATHVVQQGQANGFSKQGAQELMNGNVPSNAADRARLRSSVQHPGAAGAPLAGGAGSLATAKPGA